MSWLLPDWDGTVTLGGLLPEWAHELSQACKRYEFSSQWVWDGRSVVAKRVSGSGPALIVTRHEDEMRQALGLEPRTPSS